MKRLMPKSKIYLIGAGLLCVGVLLGTVLDGSSMVEAASSYWTFLNKNIYNNNVKNVGIGTSSPQAKLHVAGATYSANNDQDVLIGDDVGLPTGKDRTKIVFGQSDADTEVILAQDATHGILFKWDYNATATNAVGIFETYGGNNPLVLQSVGGNVGIGVTDPSGKLDIRESGAKTAADYGLYLANTATSSTDSINKYGMYVSSTGTWNGTSAINYGLYVDTPTGGTSNYAAVFEGGNVGIGITNPGVKLDVDTGWIQASNQYGLAIKDTGGTGRIVVKLDTSNNLNLGEQNGLNDILFLPGATEQMRLTTEGNLGIGTTNPSGNLNAAKSDDSGAIYVDTYDEGGTYVGSWLQLRRSNSDTLETKTTTTDGLELGGIFFKGVDSGNLFDCGAYVEVFQDGTAGSRVPARMEFITANSSGYNTNQFILDSGGNVGIGVKSEGANLQIYDATAPVIVFDRGGVDYYIGEDGNYKLYLGTGQSVGSSAIVTLMTSGNVGIGTTAPDQALDVEGLVGLEATDSPGTCNSTNEGTVYYDASMNEPCFCDGSNWKQFDGGGNCT